MGLELRHRAEAHWRYRTIGGVISGRGYRVVSTLWTNAVRCVSPLLNDLVMAQLTTKRAAATLPRDRSSRDRGATRLVASPHRRAVGTGLRGRQSRPRSTPGQTTTFPGRSGMDKLLARLRAAVRRAAIAEEATVLATDDFTVDLGTKQVLDAAGEPVAPHADRVATARDARSPPRQAGDPAPAARGRMGTSLRRTGRSPPSPLAHLRQKLGTRSLPSPLSHHRGGHRLPLHRPRLTALTPGSPPPREGMSAMLCVVPACSTCVSYVHRIDTRTDQSPGNFPSRSTSTRSSRVGTDVTVVGGGRQACHREPHAATRDARSASMACKGSAKIPAFPR